MLDNKQGDPTTQAGSPQCDSVDTILFPIKFGWTVFIPYLLTFKVKKWWRSCNIIKNNNPASLVQSDNKEPNGQCCPIKRHQQTWTRLEHRNRKGCSFVSLCTWPKSFPQQEKAQLFVVVSYHRQTIWHKSNIHRDTTDPHHQTTNYHKIATVAP